MIVSTTRRLTEWFVSWDAILHNRLRKAQKGSGAAVTSIAVERMTVTLTSPQGDAPTARRQRSFASLRTIAALVLREMETTNGRSPGGYLWAVLEPVASIALLSVLFSLAFRSPALGSSFELFYATGVIPLTIFTTVSNRVAQALLFSRPLMAYPTVTFLDAVLARFILNMLTQVMVAYVVFAGIFLIYDTKVIIKPSAIAEAMALTGMLSLGVGTLNCFLFTRFPLWQQVWSILTRPLFIISCVFVIFDGMPGWAQDWLWYNPIVHLVGMTRHGFYATYHASYVSSGYVVLVSALCMVFGLLLLRAHQRTLLT